MLARRSGVCASAVRRASRRLAAYRPSETVRRRSAAAHVWRRRRGRVSPTRSRASRAPETTSWPGAFRLATSTELPSCEASQQAARRAGSSSPMTAAMLPSTLRAGRGHRLGAHMDQAQGGFGIQHAGGDIGRELADAVAGHGGWRRRRTARAARPGQPGWWSRPPAGRRRSRSAVRAGPRRTVARSADR